jgi:hypothetical protein
MVNGMATIAGIVTMTTIEFLQARRMALQNLLFSKNILDAAAKAAASFMSDTEEDERCSP